MKRITLDTNAINRLLDSGLQQEVTAAATRSGVAFVLVHVVKDELMRMGDEDRRERLLKLYEALPKIELDTSGFVLDISKLDHAELRQSNKVAAFATTGRGRLHDALIGVTAWAKTDVLVTDDGNLTKRVMDLTAPCEVWTFEQLVRFLLDP